MEEVRGIEENSKMLNFHQIGYPEVENRSWGERINTVIEEN